MSDPLSIAKPSPPTVAELLDMAKTSNNADLVAAMISKTEAISDVIVVDRKGVLRAGAHRDERANNDKFALEYKRNCFKQFSQLSETRAFFGP